MKRFFLINLLCLLGMACAHTTPDKFRDPSSTGDVGSVGKPDNAVSALRCIFKSVDPSSFSISVESDDRGNFKAFFESIPRHYNLYEPNSEEVLKKTRDQLNRYYRSVRWNGKDYLEARMGEIAGDFDLGDVSTFEAAAEGKPYEDIYILNYVGYQSKNMLYNISTSGNVTLGLRILAVKRDTSFQPVLQIIESRVDSGTVLPVAASTGEKDERILRQRVLSQQNIPIDGTPLLLDLTPKKSIGQILKVKKTSGVKSFEVACK